jgi:DNA-directed RNA polymerase specialized sigma24 family protein
MITAFMKVFTNLKFQYKGSFEGWIRRIMVNECIPLFSGQKLEIVRRKTILKKVSTTLKVNFQ